MKPEDDKKPEWHSASSELPLDDQEWIWKNVPHDENDKVNRDVSVNGNVSDTRRNGVAEKSAFSKQEVIGALRRCNYRTSPREIASLLERLFSSYPSKQGHWLYIAQHWTPRAVNRVLVRMEKQQDRGEVTIKIPPAYFTKLIKFRKKRRSFTDSNDIRKQHDL